MAISCLPPAVSTEDTTSSMQKASARTNAAATPRQSNLPPGCPANIQHAPRPHSSLRSERVLEACAELPVYGDPVHPEDARTRVSLPKYNNLIRRYAERQQQYTTHLRPPAGGRLHQASHTEVTGASTPVSQQRSTLALLWRGAVCVREFATQHVGQRSHQIHQ